jgi:hypothetical protein
MRQFDARANEVRCGMALTADYVLVGIVNSSSAAETGDLSEL